jgi:LPXTG-site transpeptidase (sortase) family protein
VPGAVLLLAVGCLVWGVRLLGPEPPARAAAVQPVTLPAYVVEPAVRIDAVPDRAGTRVAPRGPSPAAGAPRRLVVPRLGVDAPVVGISAPDGVLVPPDDPQTLGWWREGAVPGAAEGGALLTGHTVHTGGGAFDDLETLKPGDRVVVRTGKGRIGYAVAGVTVYRKASLARDAARVFRQRGPGRLVLVTCEDWTGSTYLSNAVVFADPV